MSIRQIAKKNIHVIHMYHYIISKYVALLLHFSPKAATKFLFKKTFGYLPNFDHPRDLNEKLLWLKLNTYYKNNLITQCADKYVMRDYVKECGLEEYLVPILGTWDDVGCIDWRSLPNSFVIKCNHGCGYNIICTDKSKLDIVAASDQLKRWLKEKFWTRYAETQYKYIKPVILCEKYIDFGGRTLPTDYKIHCFHGKPVFTLICSEREIGMKMICVDNEYKPLDMVEKANDHYGGALPPKPRPFARMLEIAQILSKPFPFVRVDLYSVNGKIFIGELTFIPQGGLIRYYTAEQMIKLGEMIDLRKDSLRI